MEAFQTDAGIVETVDSTDDEVLGAFAMLVQRTERGTCNALRCVCCGFDITDCLRPRSQRHGSSVAAMSALMSF